MKTRKYFYDDKIIEDLGEQPYVLEVQLGSRLLPLVNEDAEINLQKEVEKCRNRIFAEYGLPLQEILTRENMNLESDEYSILFNGIKVGGFKGMKINQVLCLDNGDVKEKLQGNFVQTEDPSFNVDAFIIDKSFLKEAEDKGYVCVNLAKLIRINLEEVIKKNLTRFLNQKQVNELVNNVRTANPDVIDNLFFEKDFTSSKMKKILNLLLEEKVSIRDMNAILETVADNLDDKNSLLFISERVREKLSYQIMSKYADDKKVIHVIKVGQRLSEKIMSGIYFQNEDREHPYCSLCPDERKKILEKINEEAEFLIKNGYNLVFLCISAIRKTLFDFLYLYYPDVVCLSDFEVQKAMPMFSVSVDGEVDYE